MESGSETPQPEQPSKMKAKRRRHDATFKARVALEALKGSKTVQQIATEYEVHPVQVSDWKRILADGLPGAVEGKKRGGRGGSEDFEKERGELHSKIGELTVKLDFAVKKSKQLGL
jgi:transposase-like protein